MRYNQLFAMQQRWKKTIYFEKYVTQNCTYEDINTRKRITETIKQE